MNKKIKNLLIILSIILICGSIILNIYKCSHNERYVNYYDDDFCFVVICLGDGSRDGGAFYKGTILKSDYNKWKNGDEFLLTIYSIKYEYVCYHVSTLDITYIANYGSSPDWLPFIFWLNEYNM